MWGTNDGVYFGHAANATENDDNPRIGREIRYVGDRHLMTIGPNGSGKSRRVLLPNLAQLKGWSVVVVDPKGELCRMTGQHRDPRAFDMLDENSPAPAERTVILNPFGVLGLPSHGFNPVAALDPQSDDFPDDALGLAEAMIRIEGRDPHWPASAQDLVAALIMYSRLVNPDGNGGSLVHVRECLGRPDKAFREMVKVMVGVGRNKDCEELTIKAGRFESKSREIRTVVSTALTQTRWLDSRPVKADLVKGGGFDFSVLKEKPTTVYLTLPARRLGTHSTWMRAMITSILQPLLKDTRKAKVPVLLMLDEYPALAEGGFPIIEKNMAMFRGFGIKLWTVWQDLGQAERLYGKGWESFVANAGVLQSFAPQDVLTAEYLSKRMPLTAMSVEAESRSRSMAAGKPPSLSDSLNISEQGLPLMLPQHLRNMDDGFSVLFSHKTKGPVRSYFPYKVKGLDKIYELDTS